MMIGFPLIVTLDRADMDRVVPFIDPAMLLVTSTGSIPSPLRLVRSTYVDLLEGVPNPTVQSSVMAQAEALATEFGLATPLVRMTKIGPKLYVEVDGTADPDLSIAHEEEIRRSLEARLDTLPNDVWLNLELTPEH